MTEPERIRDILSENDISRYSERSAVGKCRRAADNVYSVLTEQLPDADVRVIQGEFIGAQGSAEHFYVRVGSSVVVDPTVSQFTRDNWVDGKADTHIDPDKIPNHTCVITYHDDIYSRYQ